ncbi:Cell wall protein TIR3 [Penicillium verhagenii]|nr:Cell wall protein TIR3 [Penicillium verhagenii]
MKLTQTILALAIVSAANAQLSSLPTCAQTCATNAIPASCGVDVACICDNTSFLSDIACCIVGKCTTEEQEETLKAAKGICAAGGVTNLPSVVACTTGASSSTTGSSASTTGSGSTTTGTTTETATHTKSETTTATGSETTISGTASKTDTTKASETTKSSDTTASGTVTTSTSGSAAASSTSAAAKTGGAVLGQNKDASFMAAAGVAAAFAILV